MLLEAHYRLATANDAAVIAHHRYFREGASTSKAVYAIWVREAIVAERYLGLICEIDGNPVGGAGIVKLDWGPTAFSSQPVRGRIANVFVEKHKRGLGLGSALVEHVLTEGRKAGLVEFCLASTSNSRRLYKRLGFTAYPSEMVLKGGPT